MYIFVYWTRVLFMVEDKNEIMHPRNEGKDSMNENSYAKQKTTVTPNNVDPLSRSQILKNHFICW